MERYTVEERLNLNECFIRNNGSPQLALREYRRLYPNRRVPNKKIFQRISHDLRQGNVINKKKIRAKPALSEDNQLNILLYFNNNREKSQRDAARDLENVSRTTIQRALKINGYRPYKFLQVQQLYENDFIERERYSMEIMDRNFIEGIFQRTLYTDEATFTTAGMPNRKNSHYWSSVNEHKLRPIKKQGRSSVYVWCGIIRDRIIGPVFYNYTLNGERYLSLLQNEIMPLIEALPDDLKNGLVFQQDSAPYHTVRPVIDFLNRHFQVIIGKHGTIQWPPRSPDFSPLDFYVWGELKQRVYKDRLDNVDVLKQRIQQEINRMNTTDDVANAINRLELIHTTCIANQGGHVEHII